MDPKVAKKTRDTLGKAITKPPLTDKLLGKPPFRFLHDITTSVIKTTGFMNGLFLESEMNSENVKDKDSKIAFLQKAIDMVCLVTGKSLSVKPQKIVAGHEPEKTNELLQVLAEAINMKVDNDEYVKKLTGKGKGSSEEKKDREKEARSRSGDRRKRESEEKKEKGREERDKSRDEKQKSRDREKSKDREKSRDRKKDSDKREKSPDRERDGERIRDKEQRRRKANETYLENQSDRETPIKEKNGVRKSKSSKKNIPNRKLESPSSDEKQGDSVKPNINTRSRADRPRGARRRSERQKNIVRPGDESSDDDSSSDGKLRQDKIDHKRKMGTKSRLGVRAEESKTKTEQYRDKERKGPESAAYGKGASERKTESVSPMANNEKQSSSRRKSTDSKTGRTDGKTTKDGKSRRHSSPVTPERGRKSSFTVMPHLMDKLQRDDAGKENESPSRDRIVNGEETNKEPPARLQRPTSAKGSRRRREGRHAADSDEAGPQPQRRGGAHEDEEFIQKQEPSVEEADLPPQVANARRMARPSSARPAPPRPKQDGMESEPAMRLGTGGPANVIVDDDHESDDDNFIVEESAPAPTEPEQMIQNKPEEEEGDHGALVKKMLETKKEFEEGSQQQQQSGPPKKTEIERPVMSDAARRKQREVVQREIDKLRNSIQSLTRSANPLGKIMDYVQEDLDSMQKELEKWKTENKDHSQALKRERNITDRSVEPLKAQLAELDQAIKDQLDLIAATKSNILRNDQKIDKMLKSIAKS